eukprot:GGOE01026345.1.p6 GENE.GGOE01026345.1~~GGOE01026345.1.p6  ORF type:complete len:101 (-),score=6.61 GGOE01026345.1:300-602(-)
MCLHTNPVRFIWGSAPRRCPSSRHSQAQSATWTCSIASRVRHLSEGRLRARCHSSAANRTSHARLSLRIALYIFGGDLSPPLWERNLLPQPPPICHPPSQ